jgi:hypothetical protein
MGSALLHVATAYGDVTKEQCVDANTQAQGLRRSGKFEQARELLRTCADPSCPGIIQDDCNSRLDELTRMQPTLVLTAKDAAGTDVGAVTVTMDGKHVTDTLDGTALAVDPGQHVFTFTVAGRPAVTRTLILAEGEKDRREVIDLGGAPPGPGESAASEPPSNRRTLGWIVGGAGIAAAGVGATFGLLALSQKSDAYGACGGHDTACPTAGQTSAAQAKMQDARTSGWVSTIALGVGVAAVGVGAYLVFVPGRSSASPQAALAITPSGASLVGRF